MDLSEIGSARAVEMSLDFHIAKMSPNDFHIAVQWAAKEGWNPGVHDATTFYSVNPQGLFIGSLNGEPAAMLSAVKYGESFGFLGYYIVKPEYRKQGFGWRIWQKGIEYLKGRNIGLDGVVEQQSNYAKVGFKLAHRNVRYKGLSDPSSSRNMHASIVLLSTISIDKVVAHDRLFFPEDRRAFLQSWLAQPECNALGYLQNERLVGCGVLRPCYEGFRIGPLFADTSQIAEALLVALTATLNEGSAYFIDVPEVNAEAVALAKSYGMTQVFETARMYTNEAPNLPLDRIFGITSLEFG